MFKVGELIIYSGHGICRIDDICEKTFNGITKKYYVLHPIDDDHRLTIHTPVDNDKVLKLKLMNEEEANTILQILEGEALEWIDKPHLRNQVFHDIVNSGNREEIAKLLKTLIKKKQQVEKDGRKFYESDSRLLTEIQDILFKELSIALDTTNDEIRKRVYKIVNRG